MSQGSLNPRIRFLGQNVWPVARGRTDTNVNTEGTLSGFQDFYLQPIIKDRPKNPCCSEVSLYSDIALRQLFLESMKMGRFSRPDEFGKK